MEVEWLNEKKNTV